MDNEMDALFLILDKFLNVIEYIEKYFKEEKKEVNIELGNLYTIYEEDEEDDKEDIIKIIGKVIKEEFILI